MMVTEASSESSNGSLAAEPTAQSRGRKSKSKGWVFMVLAVVVIGLIVVFNQPKPIAWQTDHDAGVRLAREEGKPILVAFVDDEILNSRRMMDILAGDGLTKRMKRFVTILVEAKEQPDLLRKYRVSAAPACVVKWPDAEDDERAAGYIRAEKVIECMDKVLARSPGS